jgi:hypothetical protein
VLVSGIAIKIKGFLSRKNRLMLYTPPSRNLSHFLAFVGCFGVERVGSSYYLFSGFKSVSNTFDMMVETAFSTLFIVELYAKTDANGL